MKALKSIVSALLTFVVLVSSMSLTIDRHVCMGQVQSISILHDATPCVMEKQVPCAEALTRMNSCCEDQHLTIKANEYNYKHNPPAQLTYQSLWVATLPRLIETLSLNTLSAATDNTRYRPPVLERDVSVLLQSFLI